MAATSIWFYLFPAYILGVLLLLMGTFALLGRIQGGRYLRPIVTWLMRVPLLGRAMKKPVADARGREPGRRRRRRAVGSSRDTARGGARIPPQSTGAPRPPPAHANGRTVTGNGSATASCSRQVEGRRR